jgi:hypothetical protein
MDFLAGFVFGAFVTAFPTVLLSYRIYKDVQRLPLERVPGAPSGVQLRRTPPKRKPKAIDDKRAWEIENAKP